MNLDTDVCNEALAHISEGVEISDIVTDTTLAGRTIRLFYPTALKFVTRAFNWPKHGRIDALAEVDNPSNKWGIAYRYPSDCEFFRGIDNGSVVQTKENQIAFEISRDSVGQIILTNESEAVGEWSVVVEDPNQWDSDFRQSFTRYLGHLVAPRITGGDQFKLGLSCFQHYQALIQRAIANAANESRKQYDNSSGASRSRR